MNTLYSSLPFMLFAFVASITPGPTNILILTSSQRYGIRATLPAVTGACVTASLIVFIAGAGAGEVLRGYPLLREGTSWVGALWLSWMSWQLFTAPAADLNEKRGEPFSGKAAAMLQLINPKTWMMALAVVSLFAPNGAHPVREVSFLSLSFLLISLLCLGAWTLLGKAVNRLFRSAASLIGFQRAMALCLLISAWAGFMH